MTSQEKSIFIQQMRYRIKEEDKGYQYFFERWNELSEEDKESLKDPILIMCLRENQIDDGPSKNYFEFQDVIKFLSIEDEYKPDIKKFVVKNGASDKSIVKLFMKLDDLGYIDNTNEEIAKLVSIIFDINYKTALSYLNNPNQMEKTKDLLG